ncbi:MAG: hypothetical protein WC614_10350 [bacterium]
MENVFDSVWMEIQRKVQIIKSLSNYDVRNEVRRIVDGTSREYNLSKEDVRNMLLDFAESRTPKLIRVVEEVENGRFARETREFNLTNREGGKDDNRW